MGENIPIFHLTVREMDYFFHLIQTDEAFLRIIGAPMVFKLHKTKIKLAPSVVKKIREALTTKLAEIGFDQNYLLTADGQMLETLLDKFTVS